MEYRRVLLKISGEILTGSKTYGHDFDTIMAIAQDVIEVATKGVEVCLVVGGGNIYRGQTAAGWGLERASSDYMGMLATVINALAIQNVFDQLQFPSRVLSAIPMNTVCESYIRKRAIRHLEKGRIVIFAAGTGNPFFTTDTAAILRSIEMNCDIVLKGTKVDGVYSGDPEKVDPETLERYSTLSYMDLLSRNLMVMDSAAISLAKDNAMKILIFNLNERGGFARVLAKQGSYTLVSKGERDEF